MYPIIYKIAIFLVTFFVMELFALYFFRFVKNKFTKSIKPTSIEKDASAIKGIIERFMLLIGFIAGIPTIVVFFGAIKIGTRLKETNDNKISNDYFLIGNALSASVAIIEYLIYGLATTKILSWIYQ